MLNKGDYAYLLAYCVAIVPTIGDVFAFGVGSSLEVLRKSSTHNRVTNLNNLTQYM